MADAATVCHSILTRTQLQVDACSKFTRIDRLIFLVSGSLEFWLRNKIKTRRLGNSHENLGEWEVGYASCLPDVRQGLWQRDKFLKDNWR